MSGCSDPKARRFLIVGGGLHGVHVAARLIGDAGIDPERIVIVDPAQHLLERWRARARTTGMTHLRSPGVHHLDLDPSSLHRFAGKRKRRRPGLFAAPYDRPSCALFDAHCDSVIQRYELQSLQVRARALECRVAPDGVAVSTSAREALVGSHLILALGSGEQLAWPAWAPPGDPRVSHIFSTDFCFEPKQDGEVVGIVGGGISAAQVALRLVAEGRRAQVIARHPIRLHQFDSDPGWLGPKFMDRFHRERDLGRRRAMIQQARHRGSMPQDVQLPLAHAIQSGALEWRQAAIESVSPEHAGLRLQLSTGDELQVQRLWLATGAAAERPGGAWWTS